MVQALIEITTWMHVHHNINVTAANILANVYGGRSESYCQHLTWHIKQLMTKGLDGNNVRGTIDQIPPSNASTNACGPCEESPLKKLKTCVRNTLNFDEICRFLGSIDGAPVDTAIEVLRTLLDDGFGFDNAVGIIGTWGLENVQELGAAIQHLRTLSYSGEEVGRILLLGGATAIADALFMFTPGNDYEAFNLEERHMYLQQDMAVDVVLVHWLGRQFVVPNLLTPMFANIELHLQLNVARAMHVLLSVGFQWAAVIDFVQHRNHGGRLTNVAHMARIVGTVARMGLEGLTPGDTLHILRHLDVPGDLGHEDAALRVVGIIARLMGQGFSMGLIRRLLGERRRITIEMIEALGNGALRMLNEIEWNALEAVLGGEVVGGRYAYIELRLRTIETVNDVNAFVNVQVQTMVDRIVALHDAMEEEQNDPLNNVDEMSTVTSADDL